MDGRALPMPYWDSSNAIPGEIALHGAVGCAARALLGKIPFTNSISSGLRYESAMLESPGLCQTRDQSAHKVRHCLVHFGSSSMRCTFRADVLK